MKTKILLDFVSCAHKYLEYMFVFQPFLIIIEILKKLIEIAFLF